MAEIQKPGDIPKEQGPVEPPKSKEVLKAKEETLKKIQEVLKEYNGMESNIPMSHEYWKLVEQYRGM